MKALILAAGYATRLYPLTKDSPKPLLPVAGRPILEYILDKLDLPQMSEALVVTNSKFYPNFVRWAEKSKWREKVRIIDDGTSTEETKLGAVGDMRLIIEREGADDMLIVAGDNLFSFDLKDFISFAVKVKPAATIGLYNVQDRESVKRYSMVELNSERRVVRFEEKPPAPVSNLISICLYYLPREKLGRVAEYIRLGRNPDAPGYYVSWLCGNDEVYGFGFSGTWFDIGDIKCYQEADRVYSERRI